MRVYSAMASFIIWSEPALWLSPERAEIDAAEELVGFERVGVLGDLVLGGLDRVLDTAGAEVEVGEAVAEVGRGGVGGDGEFVLVDGF